MPLPLSAALRLALPSLALWFAACGGTGPGSRGGSYDRGGPYDYSLPPKENDFERDGFGESPLPIWMGLTAPELNALQARGLAEAGDPEALLDLAIFGSGGPRDEAGYQSIRRRVEAFVIQKRRDIDTQKTDYLKGLQLFRAMHAEFFPSPFWGGAGDEDPRRAGYDFDQSSLVGIFTHKKFNCVSSAILYVILARHFGLDVQGVAMKSHAFAQLRADGRVIEIETTSPRGYGLVHDEAFYRKKAPSWSVARGLGASTYEDYQARRILSPLQLIAWNMNNQHVHPARMAQMDRCRLAEAWAYLDPSSRDAQYNRLALYNAEYRWLKERKDFSAMRRMYAKVSPALPEIRAGYPSDPEIQNRVAWAWFAYASVFNDLGRVQEGVPYADSSLACVRKEDKEWRPVLANNLAYIQLAAADLAGKGRFTEAENLLNARQSYAEGDTAWRMTRAWLHAKWAQECWKRKDWPGAITQFEKQKSHSDPEDMGPIAENLANAYINWAAAWQDKGDMGKAKETLSRCAYKLNAGKCKELLQRIAAAEAP